MFFQFVASFAMFERKVMLETQTILQFFYKVLMWHGSHYLLKKKLLKDIVFLFIKMIFAFFLVGMKQTYLYQLQHHSIFKFVNIV